MNEKEKNIEEMTEDLKEAVGADTARICAEAAVRLGYRKERYACWIRDESFVSDVKVRYVCSTCGHWNVVKFQNAQTMLYQMKYCNGCGSKVVAVRE